MSEDKKIVPPVKAGEERYEVSALNILLKSAFLTGREDTISYADFFFTFKREIVRIDALISASRPSSQSEGTQ